MNETINNIKTRRSIKKYKSDMISDEIINSIMEAGTYAPSGMNRQSSIIVAIKDKETRDKLSKLNAKIMGNGAPVVLIVLADKNVRTYLYDGSLVMSNMMLAAHSLGLGSCWIHRAKEMFETEEGKAVLSSLGIDGEYEGIGNCIIGYADEIREASPRKDNFIFKL